MAKADLCREWACELRCVCVCVCVCVLCVCACACVRVRVCVCACSNQHTNKSAWRNVTRMRTVA